MGMESLVLELAADYLVGADWYRAQDESVLPNRVCAATAIARVNETQGADLDDVGRKLMAHLGLVDKSMSHGFNWGPIFKWNDAQASKQDVIDKLREAARA